jgi:hypothetical protein
MSGMFPPPAQLTPAAASAAEALAGTDSAKFISPATLAASRAPLRNALAPRGGVMFDGTANARVLAALPGQQIGLNPFSLVYVLSVPASNPTAEQFVSTLGYTNGNAPYDDVFVTINTVGALRVNHRFSSADNVLTLASFVSSYAGKVVIVAYSESPTARSLWVNGVLAASAGGLTGNVGTGGLVLNSPTTGNPFTGTIHSATLYNLALSAADVLEIYELGGAVPERFKFGSQSADRVTTGRALSFGATDAAVGLSTIGSGGSGIAQTGVAGARTGGSGAFYLRLVANGTGSFFTSAELAAGAVAIGRALRVTGWGRRASAGGTLTINNVTVPATADWTYFSGEGVQGTAHNGALAGVIAFNGTLNDEFHVDDVRIIPLGAVVHLPLNDGAGLQLRDDSTNRLHALMTTTGVSHILPKLGGAFPLRFTTSTSGNQQALGAACVPLNVQVLRIRARTQSGTSTVSLGNASGGAQLVSAAALTTAWSVLTIVGGSHITSTQNLWVNSNNANVIEWDIELEELRV